MGIEVIYNGSSYTMRDRSVADVQSEIDAILADGGTGWLRVADGFGSPEPARLLVGPGIGIALLPQHRPAAEDDQFWPVDDDTGSAG